LAIARKAEEAAEAERVILIREGAVKGQKEKANLKDGKVERKKRKKIERRRPTLSKKIERRRSTFLAKIWIFFFNF
jgi:hypothetical protein